MAGCVVTGQVRILVTGSRSWTCRDTIADALAVAVGQYGAHLAEWNPESGRMELDWSGVTVVHGAARGADRIAADVAEALGCRPEPHPADWSRCGPTCKPGHRKLGPAGEYCPSAGHRRNADMVARGAAVCLAFVVDNSSGSVGCAKLAANAGIPVVRHDAAVVAS